MNPRVFPLPLVPTPSLIATPPSTFFLPHLQEVSESMVDVQDLQMVGRESSTLEQKNPTVGGVGSKDGGG